MNWHSSQPVQVVTFGATPRSGVMASAAPTRQATRSKAARIAMTQDGRTKIRKYIEIEKVYFIIKLYSLFTIVETYSHPAFL
jgi:hypothetical protein